MGDGEVGEVRVVVCTGSFDDACRFWGDVLGWTVTKSWDEPDRGRIFGRGGDARVELLEEAGAVAPAGLVLSIEVDDVDETWRHLQAAGVTIDRAPADQPWGHRNVVVSDPTGATVVLFQDLVARPST